MGTGMTSIHTPFIDIREKFKAVNERETILLKKGANEMRVLKNKQVKEYEDENGNHVQETIYSYEEKPIFGFMKKNNDPSDHKKVDWKKVLGVIAVVAAGTGAVLAVAGRKKSDEVVDIPSETEPRISENDEIAPMGVDEAPAEETPNPVETGTVEVTTF